ncbi:MULTISPECIES: hypothetical protein [unclassified Sphingomonas]|jgi:hypothetical protein|uniref:hypothetical protein n=1 Tax=unclassified Sphingomonas TaxID=196159 RepID=UPI000AA0EB05|nr:MULTISPECIES: hypothetical protein [unclassified Sphingomonas]
MMSGVIKKRMAIDKIHLRKLLQYFGLPNDRRLAAVKADARSELRKLARTKAGGADFHSCFWADAKRHVSGFVSLDEEIVERVKKNRSRERLYPLLADGFLSWWHESRRWINEEIYIIPEPVTAPYHFIEIDGQVKVQNLLALKVGGGSCRLIYPYFSEMPTLTEDTARLGLWLMSQAFPKFNVEDMRILDVLRGKSHAGDQLPLRGNEGAIFVERYAKMLADWRSFKAEFSTN